MAELTPELAPQVVAACTANAEEAAGALGRAFDSEFVVKAGEPTPREQLPPDATAGPGLAFAFKFGDEGMLATLPASSGLVPDWAKDPDPTGTSKLSTLAQELSMLLVPDTLMADVFEAVWVEDLAEAVQRSKPADDAFGAPIELAQGESLGQLTLLWSVADPTAALHAPADEQAAPAEAPAEAPAPAAAPAAAPAEQPQPQSKVLRWSAAPARDLRDLPPHTRSALRVTVPVSVNLAGKKVELKDVVELGPGSILTFDKACDAPLEVSVGGHPVAMGDAVKVGERFGVRVTKMILPDEHFRPLLSGRTR